MKTRSKLKLAYLIKFICPLHSSYSSISWKDMTLRDGVFHTWWNQMYGYQLILRPVHSLSGLQDTLNLQCLKTSLISAQQRVVLAATECTIFTIFSSHPNLQVCVIWNLPIYLKINWWWCWLMYDNDWKFCISIFH